MSNKRRSERKIELAKELEGRLKKEGRHGDALVVGDARRALVAARRAALDLHADNMELRQRLGLPSYLDDVDSKSAA
ncbi:MAG: hypothetical protein AAGJ91_12735 [Pseudomonadota bacterium]